MAVVRCKNGLHFYDDDKFDECPHCAKGINENQQWDQPAEMNNMMTLGLEDIDPNIVDLVGIMEERPLREQFRIDDIDSDVTVAYYSAHKGNDFITGWLVCVGGPERGRDYRIYHGMNKMGRSDDMDIVIKDDMSISREKVCSIVYEEKNNKFYLVPSVNGMIYLNDEILNEAREIVTGDRFVVGRSTFEFVAFCTGDKKWGFVNEE